MIYIVTAAHNRKEITISLVKSLQKQTYTEWRFLLVDDGSTDGTSDEVKKILPTSIILFGDGNLWWGGALQRANQWLVVNAADDDAVFFCNDDIFLPDDFLEKGIKGLEKFPSSMIIGNGYSVHDGTYLDGALQFFDSTGKHDLLQPGSIGNMSSTRALFLRMTDLKKIGGFRPALLPHYGSDYEYTIRASKLGIDVRSLENLNYQMDEKTTGNRGRKNIKINKIFSKKSQYNPIYKMTFIILTAPVKYWPKRIYKIIFR